jgi:hypothetical protein
MYVRYEDHVIMWTVMVLNYITLGMGTKMMQG